MTERPAYFVVSRVMGREMPALYWDDLPREGVRNLVYVVRLDELPNARQLVRTPLAQLYAMFCHLRLRGKLPPRWGKKP